MGKAVTIVYYLSGPLVLFFGMVFMVLAFTLPMMVGLPLLIVGLLIAITGGIIIHLGERSYKKQHAYTQG